MNYLEQIELLESEIQSSRTTLAQITIDMVQSVQLELGAVENVEIDDLLSAGYAIKNLLEVFNPKMKDEIKVLKNLYKILELWHESLSENGYGVSDND